MLSQDLSAPPCHGGMANLLSTLVSAVLIVTFKTLINHLRLCSVNQIPKLNVEGSSPFARFDKRLKQPCFVFCAPPLARAQKAIKMLELDELLEFESHGHSKIQSSE